MMAWVQEHEVLLWGLGSLSVVVFLATLVLVPWLIIRIPADYFTHARKERMALVVHNPVLRILFRFGRNCLGAVFVLAGIAMLVLPGQGVLTILIGLTLMNFPGKERILRWIVSRRSVFVSINWIRGKAGKNPLILEAYKDGSLRG